MNRWNTLHMFRTSSSVMFYRSDVKKPGKWPLCVCKGKWSTAVCNKPHCYGSCMPYGITQCYLPPDSGEIPTFTQPIKAGSQFSDPGGMQGWVDPVVYTLNCTSRIVDWHSSHVSSVSDIFVAFSSNLMTMLHLQWTPATTSTEHAQTQHFLNYEQKHDINLIVIFWGRQRWPSISMPRLGSHGLSGFRCSWVNLRNVDSVTDCRYI